MVDKDLIRWRMEKAHEERDQARKALLMARRNTDDLEVLEIYGREFQKKDQEAMEQSIVFAKHCLAVEEQLI